MKELKFEIPADCEVDKIETQDGHIVITLKEKEPKLPRSWEVFSLEIGETLCFGEAQNVKKSYEEACEAAIKYCLENLV